MLNVDVLNDLGTHIYEMEVEDREAVSAEIDRIRKRGGVSLDLLLILDKVQDVLNELVEEDEIEPDMTGNWVREVLNGTATLEDS